MKHRQKKLLDINRTSLHFFAGHETDTKNRGDTYVERREMEKSRKWQLLIHPFGQDWIAPRRDVIPVLPHVMIVRTRTYASA